MECWKALLDSISLLRSRTGLRVCMNTSVCVWWWGTGAGRGGVVARDLRLPWPGNRSFLLLFFNVCCTRPERYLPQQSHWEPSLQTPAANSPFSQLSLLKQNIIYTTYKTIVMSFFLQLVIRPIRRQTNDIEQYRTLPTYIVVNSEDI